MIVHEQKPIEVRNTCGAIFDESDLVSAILWYSSKSVCRLKSVYIHGKYPTVSIYSEKLHIHRLLWMYWNQSDIDDGYYIHHKNRNKLDATKENLELIDAREHQSLHNRNKELSKEHRQKISEANRRRKGVKIKKQVDMPELAALVKQGWSVNKIAKHYGCDWSTVKSRIYENPDLLK